VLNAVNTTFDAVSIDADAQRADMAGRRRRDRDVQFAQRSRPATRLRIGFTSASTIRPRLFFIDYPTDNAQSGCFRASRTSTHGDFPVLGIVT